MFRPVTFPLKAQSMSQTEVTAGKIASAVQPQVSVTINWQMWVTFFIEMLQAAVVCGPLLFGARTPKQFIDDNYTDDGEPNQTLVDRFSVKAHHLNRKHEMGLNADDLTTVSVATLNELHESDNATLGAIMKENEPE